MAGSPNIAVAEARLRRAQAAAQIAGAARRPQASASAAATSETNAAQAEAAQARLMLATAIASAYAELARQHAAHDTAVAALEVRTKTVALFRHRHENGLETLGSVRQVESRSSSAEADVLAVEERLALQRNSIAALVGAGPDRGLAITRPTVEISRSFADLPAGFRPADAARPGVAVLLPADRSGEATRSLLGSGMDMDSVRSVLDA